MRRLKLGLVLGLWKLPATFLRLLALRLWVVVVAGVLDLWTLACSLPQRWISFSVRPSMGLARRLQPFEAGALPRWACGWRGWCTDGSDCARRNRCRSNQRTLETCSDGALVSRLRFSEHGSGRQASTVVESLLPSLKGYGW